MLHELALLTKDQLAALDKYWGSLAKIINVWRTGSNAKTIFASWQYLYGPERAKEAAGSLPPRPLRGRWGSATRTEQFILRATRAELVAVFKDALVDRAAKKKKEPKKAVPDIDEDF